MYQIQTRIGFGGSSASSCLLYGELVSVICNVMFHLCISLSKVLITVILFDMHACERTTNFFINGRDFSASATWELIRTRRPTVPWSKLVWFAQGVPRYTFITWLAVRDRLSTDSKMRAWGQVQCCLLCGEPDKTHDHLFFSCPCTYTLWLQVIGSLLQPGPSPDWNEILARIMADSVGLLASILLRLAFQLSIYYIWKERNGRRHAQPTTPVNQLAKFIERL